MVRYKAILSALAPLIMAPTAAPSRRPVSAAAVVMPNDNRTPAGALVGRVLTVRLEARTGMWYPEGPNGRGLEVAAWAEPGKPLSTPGPLIRVPVGTEVRGTVRNTLARRLTVYGFGTARGRADSAAIDAGATREFKFTASTPGTYYYLAHGTLGMLDTRVGDDTQLNGAIIVDSANAAARPNDRVFLMSWWFTFDSTSKTGLGQATMAINGLSWPHTERIELTQGDSVRWRVINLTESDHPMHLHGFYFQMESKGDGVRDTVYTARQRRLGVTEIIIPNQTMSLAWAPTRPGNWIYHCHFSGHISHIASLETTRGEFDEAALAHHASDRPHQMYGLILGISVRPKGPLVQDTRVPQPKRLVIREKERVYGDRPGYAFVLDGTPEASDPAALPMPGTPLILEKGSRVAVNIVNRTRQPAAVHWHGIELESFPDGVPGWSGQGKDVLQPIPPGDSMMVRFTVPRAGTFMYHSHFNEDQQINSGLYAPIIVLEPGQRYNPETDRVLMFTSAGQTTNVITGPWAPTLLNGHAQPASFDLRAGTKYRFRLINITSDVNTLVRLLDGDKPVMWRALAKDGATLPPWQATARPAVLFFDPGEIYDFEYIPPAAGTSLSLKFGAPDAPPEFGLPKTITVPVRVQ
jgi:FtsP/CotA-like multicopper oxidase with cupredoxin domain